MLRNVRYAAHGLDARSSFVNWRKVTGMARAMLRLQCAETGIQGTSGDSVLRRITYQCPSRGGACRPLEALCGEDGEKTAI
jgi:hypothetical protein